MAVAKKKKLGELLLAEGLLTPEQLADALQEQKRSGERLGRIVSRYSRISEEDIIQVLGRQLGIRYIDFDAFLIDPAVIRLVPERAARRNQGIPVYEEDGELVVAMTDPLNVFATDDISRASGRRVRPAVAKEAEIQRALDQYYGGEAPGRLRVAPETLETPGLEALAGDDVAPERLAEAAEETPVVRLANSLLLQAVADKASDVHLEPDESGLHVRLRIDGVLHHVNDFPRSIHAALLSRLKIMANMDIAEKRQAQDGRFQLRVGNRNVDVRVATIPSIHGEKMALRILDTSTALLPLSGLGMAPDALRLFSGLLERPHGLILITGPTGSGKTTTLYAALREMDAGRKNIITIEDPVEYQLKGITQVQVNPRSGITFAGGLRAILRQDPDVVMVGEIRDRETAQIAIHSALTGHLVFSTLHTNDAPGAVTRLLEMGVEPFLAASSIEGIVAQRLVRLVCADCRVAVEPEGEAREEIGLPPGGTIFRGTGCGRCKGTGYLGRTGLFEVLTAGEELRRLIVRRASADELRAAALVHGYRPLRAEGLKSVREGLTTIEEVLRVSSEAEA